jgi:hypothetical protein
MFIEICIAIHNQVLQDIDKNKFLLRGSINRQAVTEYPLEHLTYQEVLLLLLRAEEF